MRPQPPEAQQYLNDIWALIRTDLNRKDIKLYGFCITETQHDGNEKGAKEIRCNFKGIDYSKVGATGYIAKYVSKNVNGANLDIDIDGVNAIEAAQRVQAWTSCWGTRQFQQLGAGAVTDGLNYEGFKRSVTKVNSSLIFSKLQITTLGQNSLNLLMACFISVKTKLFALFTKKTRFRNR